MANLQSNRRALAIGIERVEFLSLLRTGLLKFRGYLGFDDPIVVVGGLSDPDQT